MEAKEIGAIIDSMHEDELDVLSQLLSLADPERSDAMMVREAYGKWHYGVFAEDNHQ